jgi:ADP-ribose pyrophosphatase YjhB (NUDIX family)
MKVDSNWVAALLWGRHAAAATFAVDVGPQTTNFSAMRVSIIQAASVAILKDGRFLLVERGRAPSKGLFAFPGGRLEQGETPEQAARRELFEETGLTAGKLRLWRIIDLGGSEQEGGPIYRLHVFLGHSVEGDPVAADDAASLGWFSLDEMGKLPITDSTLAAARAIVSGGQVAE